MSSKEIDIFYFLLNEDFKKWVLEPTYERDLFWSTYVKNHPDELNAINAAKEFIRTTNYYKSSISQHEKDAVLAKIIKEDPSFIHKSTQRKNFNFRLKAAATVLLVCIFSVLTYFILQHKTTPQLQYISKKTTQGQRATIKLSDGSRVILNCNSEIIFDENYGGTHRKIKLEGEAFFNVAKNEALPFIVTVDTLHIQALGTAFNVNAYHKKKSIKVSLQEGHLMLQDISSAAPQSYLKEGEAFSITKDNWQKSTIDYGDINWKDGILTFQNASLPQVKETLEHWYGVQVTVAGSPENNWRVNGKFKNQGLREVLEGLSYTYDVQYKIKGKHVELKF